MRKMRPKIYLFGDSITEMSFENGGWGASLVNHFARQVDVVLRGFSGYNTRWALRVFNNIFPVEDGGNGDSQVAVTVFFGANDASLPNRCSAFQHVPLPEYKQNLHSIISSIKLNLCHVIEENDRSINGLSHEKTSKISLALLTKRWPAALVILIAPPPIDEDARLLYPYCPNPLGLPERTNEAAGSYARAGIVVAEECGIPVVDLWTAMQQIPDWKTTYLKDGLHLTPSGNQVVFDQVVLKLKEAEWSVEKLPVDLPLISEIDPIDPLNSFENL